MKLGTLFAKQPAPVMHDVTPRPPQRTTPRPVNPSILRGFFRGD
jgi:hypothetical protein